MITVHYIGTIVCYILYTTYGYLKRTHSCQNVLNWYTQSKYVWYCHEQLTCDKVSFRLVIIFRCESLLRSFLFMTILSILGRLYCVAGKKEKGPSERKGQGEGPIWKLSTDKHKNARSKYSIKTLNRKVSQNTPSNICASVAILESNRTIFSHTFTLYWYFHACEIRLFVWPKCDTQAKRFFCGKNASAWISVSK